MFTAIIENEGNTLVMEFPCKRYLMADHLGSIGIRKPAHEIKCMDEEEEPIKVKIVGNNEFEKRLALLISPTDTLSLVNTMCEFYQNLPYQNKLGKHPYRLVLLVILSLIIQRLIRLNLICSS